MAYTPPPLTFRQSFLESFPYLRDLLLAPGILSMSINDSARHGAYQQVFDVLEHFYYNNIIQLANGFVPPHIYNHFAQNNAILPDVLDRILSELTEYNFITYDTALVRITHKGIRTHLMSKGFAGIYYRAYFWRGWKSVAIAFSTFVTIATLLLSFLTFRLDGENDVLKSKLDYKEQQIDSINNRIEFREQALYNQNLNLDHMQDSLKHFQLDVKLLTDSIIVLKKRKGKKCPF